MKFTLNGVDSTSIPSDDEIRIAIASLTPGSDSFAILGTDSQFVQCALGKNGKIVLEWRNTSGFHRTADNGLTLDKVAAVFLAYKNHVDGWSKDFQWTTITSEPLSRNSSWLLWLPALIGLPLCLMTKNITLTKTVFALMAVTVLIINLIALKTGVITLKSSTSYRKDDPLGFWFFFLLYSLLFAVLCFVAFSNRITHFG